MRKTVDFGTRVRTVISLRFRLPELDNSCRIRKVLRTTGTRYRPFVALAARVAFLALITRYYRTFQWKNTRPRRGFWIMAHAQNALPCESFVKQRPRLSEGPWQRAETEIPREQSGSAELPSQPIVLFIYWNCNFLLDIKPSLWNISMNNHQEGHHEESLLCQPARCIRSYGASSHFLRPRRCDGCDPGNGDRSDGSRDRRGPCGAAEPEHGVEPLGCHGPERQLPVSAGSRGSGLRGRSRGCRIPEGRTERHRPASEPVVSGGLPTTSGHGGAKCRGVGGDHASGDEQHATGRCD